MSENISTFIGSPLPVMEHFYTVQGEGFYTGHAAYFVRLGGCDVGCPWCDVKDSWDANVHPTYAVENISNWVADAKANICVITGGEPLMHPLDALTATLKNTKCRVHIETSGTSPFSGDFDWITFSPKRYKKPLPIYYEKAHELKIIVSHNNDLRWAEEHKSKINTACLLYLQPEWDKRAEMMPLIVDFVKQNPEWKISLQTHKYLGID